MTEGHDNTMNLESFETLLDRHGGDPVGWPADARAEAERFLAVEPRAQAALADAVALARGVAGAPSFGASPELMARVLADTPHAHRRTGFGAMLDAVWPFGPAWRPAAALAAALILGVVTGYTAPLPSGFGDSVTGSDDMAVLTYSLDQGLEDIE